MGKRKGNELSTITSSELSSVIYSTLGETIKNPFSREIFLLWVRVAGIRYRENIDELLENLEVGEKVILVREPDNEYDDLAIMIQNEDKEKLGYVPRVNNDILARLMDAGMKLSGKVSKIKDPEDGEYSWDALSVDIFLDENGSNVSGGNESCSGDNGSYLLSESEKQPKTQSKNSFVDPSKDKSKNPGDGFFSKISGLLHTTFSGGMNKPFTREIFLAHDPALEYYKLPNLKRVLCKMKVGDKVLLRREQDHENDKMAIVVLNKRKRKLGYIPRSHNVVLSRLMEAGKHIYGITSKIDYEKDGVGGHNSITIDVYMED